MIAGVDRSHIPVSQTRAISAFSSFAFSARKAGNDGDPVSSSPSNSTVIWQGGAAELLEGAAGLEKGHELAFVVASASGHDLFAMRPGLELRLERRVSPKIQRIDRLHVIVTVEEDARRFAARRRDVADDHRTAGGRTLRRLESKIA